MQKLQVLVYVSTAYTNTDKSIIDEKIYPPQHDWKDIINMVETLDENILEILKKKILDQFPNSYTFSKFLSEAIMHEERENLPIVVFRPSIVVPSIEDPLHGWVDNFNGPMGLVVGCVSGFLHVMYGDANATGDFIPVDLAISAIIITSWYKVNFKKTSKKCLVVNAATASIVPFTYGRFLKGGIALGIDIPTERLLWYPFCFLVSQKQLHFVMMLLFHVFPAYIFDFFLKLKGDKLRLMKLYRKVYLANNELAFFMTNNWQFSIHNYLAMIDITPVEEKTDFKIDFRYLVPEDVMRRNLPRANVYLLKDSEDSEKSLPKNRAKLRRMFWLHCAVCTIFSISFVLLLWWLRKIVFK